MATVEQFAETAVDDSPSLDLHRIDFRYEPFPVGFAQNVVSAGYYDRLLATWPDERLFAYKPTFGNKYSLSKVNNGELFLGFLERTEPWLMFHRLIKSEAFVHYVLECLRNHNVELGYTPDQINARFEFSMLSGNGGNIVPHTDSPAKIVTLVLYMTRLGEWNPAFGGGTSMLKPRDIRKNYNELNVNLGFDEVDCLFTYPFVPNGCLVFVKTFNSYHAVYPIMGRADLPRKSITINLELKDEPRAIYASRSRPQFRLQ